MLGTGCSGTLRHTDSLLSMRESHNASRCPSTLVCYSMNLDWPQSVSYTFLLKGTQDSSSHRTEHGSPELGKAKAGQGVGTNYNPSDLEFGSCEPQEFEVKIGKVRRPTLLSVGWRVSLQGSGWVSHMEKVVS